MIPQQWASPCGNQCTNKYAALTQIPWRVFCKKGCNFDGDTWEECLEECNQICYKDPVLKDQQWSAYIDRSPGADSYSEECFHACVSGCGYKVIVRKGTHKVENCSAETCNCEGNVILECHIDILVDTSWFLTIYRRPVHMIAASLLTDECNCVISVFEIHPEKADKVCPNRPLKPPPVPKPKPQPVERIEPPEDVPCTSA